MQLQWLAFEDAIKLMQTAPKTNVSLILQPHHPLDRQSPGFRRLSHAAERAHGATIYFPEEIRAAGNVILLAGQEFNEDTLSFAQTLSSQSKLDLEFAQDVNNLKSLAAKLLSMPSPIRPVLALVDQLSLNARPTELMKIAAVTGVAMLSYRQGGV